MKADLVDHRKFLRLQRLLGEPKAHVIGYLMLMWRRGYQTGNPYLGDDLDVEAAAEFTGEPGKFATAAHSAGFIDRLADNKYRIHDLWDHAPEWARKRMARNGNLPDGVTSYSGITPVESRRAASKTPKRTPRGVQTGETDAARHTEERGKRKDPPNPPQAGGEVGSASPSPDSRPARARDDLFDAIVEVTGSDPSLHGSTIGRLRRELLAALPPYSPAEVRAMSSPDFQSREMPWLDGRKPTTGEVKKYISRTRNPSSGAPTKTATPTKPSVVYDPIPPVPTGKSAPIPWHLKPSTSQTAEKSPKTGQGDEFEPASW